MKNFERNELQEILKNCKSKADFCRALELKPAGGNYAAVDRIIRENNLDTYFTNEPWNKGICYRNRQYTLEEALVENSPYRTTYHLKHRLFDSNLKEQKCEICGYTENLELHHINGNPYDNRLENLQILCPNCHAKTDNYRIKNSKGYKGRHSRDPKELILTEEEVKQRNLERKAKKAHKTVEEYLNSEHRPRESKNPKRILICPVCGKEFVAKDSTSKYCSQECYKEDTKGNRPSLPQLIKDFSELGSFIQVGNKYNVSDNAVRKWCKLYQIPFHTKELKEYIQNFNNPDYIPKECVKKEIKRLDHQKIIDDYNSGLSTTEVAKLHNCDSSSIRNVLSKHNIKLRKTNFKYIIQYLDENNIINEFEGSTMAAKWILENTNTTTAKLESVASNIKRVCTKDNNYTYGYYWKYKD